MWRFIISILLFAPAMAGCDFFKDAAPLPPPVVLKKKPAVSDEIYAASGKRHDERHDELHGERHDELHEELNDDSADLPNSSDETASFRVSLLQEELDRHQIRRIRHSLSAYPTAMDMMSHLQSATGLVNDIYALQVNGNNPIWREQIVQSGTAVEKQYISLFFRPWCQLVSDVQCNAVASLPQPQTGTVFWPVGFNRADFDAVKRMINAKELLSPYALIVHDGPSRLQTVPYPHDSRFGALFAQLSKAFMAAAEANQGRERTLLKKLSGITAEGDIHTFGIDDEVQQGGEGEWRIYWHGDSTALDSFGIKRAFGLTVGRVHAASQDRLHMYNRHVEEIRREYERIFQGAPPLVQVASVEAWTPVDVWMAAGSALDMYGMVNQNNGVDAHRRSILLQPYEAVRQGYLNRFSNSAIASGVALDAWADAFGAVHAATALAPESAVWHEEDGTVNAKRQMSAEFTQTVLQAIRFSGALWLVHVTGLLEASVSENAEQRVAALLAEFFHLQRTGSENAQRVMTWLIRQLADSGAIIKDMDSGSDMFRFNAPQVLLTGKALFERLNLDVSQGKRSDLQQLFLDAAQSASKPSVTPDVESQLLQTIADDSGLQPVVFDFWVDK